jgi:trimeric autotransporter adhesin
VHVTGNLTVDGAINPPSDRAVKAEFREVNPRLILQKLLQLKIELWKYQKDQGKADHIGPMSQDFSKAFSVGTDDKHISTVDADGVALAAIQGLHAELLERDEKLEAQQKTIEAQQKMIDELKERMDKLSPSATR